MDDNLLMSFLKKIELLNEYDYAEKCIGYMLSPVITGIKPASTITLKNCKRKLYNFWNEGGIIYYINIIWNLLFFKKQMKGLFC